MESNRRYDIDWLRIITIALLLIYHVAIVFQPWGALIRFIQSNETMEGLWKIMLAINIWRIPILFFVSGMGVYFAMRKRSWKQLLKERTKRILIPFLFGIVAITPLHHFLWLDYYNQEVSYEIQPSHLWFLANIFMYVLILSPVFYLLRKKEDNRFKRLMGIIMKNPLGLLLFIIPFILEVIIVNPEIFELYALTMHGFLLGFIAFFTGFMFVLSGKTIWETMKRWKWLYFLIAITLYVLRITVFDTNSPNYLKAIESNLWIIAILGFGFKYLNKPSAILSYLSKAAYPVYILHMIFLYLGSYIILPFNIPTLIQFILIVMVTFAGSIFTYEFIIKRINILGLVFGLKVDFSKKIQMKRKQVMVKTNQATL